MHRFNTSGVNMAVDPATAYLVSAAVIVVILVAISVFCGGSNKKPDANREGQAAKPRAREGPPAARAGGVRRRNVRRGRMQMADDENSDEEDGAGVDRDGADNEEGMFDEFGQNEGKIGAKKLRKLQEKEEKKRQREMELQDREEKKEREKKLESQRKRDEAREKAEEEAQAEEERIRKEEEEKREHEEYLKLKQMFSVEEEGESEQAGDLDSVSLLQEFINYIKEMKVVMLEDLAAHFKIKTQDCINRIQDLISDGKLTGVIDDRGKFIYITVEELDSVVKFIKQHGRVSIRELAESSNRLINLNPDNDEIRKKLLVGDAEPDLIEDAE